MPPDQGLSPRVRGNPMGQWRGSNSPGSIPACAGEPSCYRPGTRGKKGLSPRVRGNPSNKVYGVIAGGSIPACAGEPPAGCRRCAAPRVYPRVCGGTRGRHPARGGRGGVYPRVCGGTWTMMRYLQLEEGLSPRVRGNHDVLLGLPAPFGSIPACAGEPPDGVADGPGGPGSIPGCAGEPLSFLLSLPSRRVYPRVCGGTKSSRTPRWKSQGLSPRVRGNLRRADKEEQECRSIPACAGEPR